MCENKCLTAINVSRQTKRVKSYNKNVKTLVETGARGEDVAVKHLKKKGYKIITRNHCEKWGELDIIAISSDKTLVFVEVKAMNARGQSGLKPEDHLTAKKLGKLRRLSSFYANGHPTIIDPKRGWRIDLIALTIDDNYCHISHYENIG